MGRPSTKTTETTKKEEIKVEKPKAVVEPKTKEKRLALKLRKLQDYKRKSTF